MGNNGQMKAKTKGGDKDRTSVARVRAETIAMEFVTGGVDAVAALISSAESKPCRFTLRKSLKLLKEREVDLSPLDDWCRKQFGFGLENRNGPHLPPMGSQKRYKAQQSTKYGGPFVKVPLFYLGISKGDGVDLTFLNDKIVISRPS